jgi:peptidoglycan/xylan/chitin deacetylase (PgdA/CDA1 family)
MLLTLATSVRLPVLIYHRVGPDDPDPRSRWLTVPTEKFDRQIAHLARAGYTAVRPADWLAYRSELRPLPSRPVLITFDDAYQDVATHAFPILARHGMTATTFVVTGQLGGTNAWDAGNGFPARRLMSAEEIKHWAKRGFEFGGHSHGHVELTKLGPAELDAELATCQRELTDLLGAPAVSFAYPYGSHDGAVRAATGRHFGAAFGVVEGINDAAADPLALFRTYVFPTDLMLDFSSRARLGFSVIRRVQERVRLRSRLSALLGRKR